MAEENLKTRLQEVVLSRLSRPNLPDYTPVATGSGHSPFAVAFFRTSLMLGLLALVATLLMAFGKNLEIPKRAIVGVIGAHWLQDFLENGEKTFLKNHP